MCETKCTVAINSVINWSFFLLYLCFSIFSCNFIDSESAMTVSNQFQIRRLDTWRHRARDHSTRRRPLPTCWRSFVTKPLSPAIFEILASKCIGITTLTFQGHVTLSVTWPFDSQVAISCRWSIVTKSLSPAIFEIMATKHMWSRPWPFRVTWRHRSHDHLISRWPFPTGTLLSPSRYLQPFSR